MGAALTGDDLVDFPTVGWSRRRSLRASVSPARSIAAVSVVSLVIARLVRADQSFHVPERQLTHVVLKYVCRDGPAVIEGP
jgi:hypothetical protein